MTSLFDVAGVVIGIWECWPALLSLLAQRRSQADRSDGERLLHCKL